ncbi:18s rRNA (guanine-n(7))-methyltransferase-related [Anaeramoeba flamelloides]|uniref:18s rRNA (Guanine-n(7))-methyltransferase-related n=1 Tax=Anaeramoeba flamelloides TaxID=1746091 RepID=A0AAV7Z4Q1_9EUKA|nr:18s rRNA (guanine-n(7))-methyltransferase-related [Anaeramoeba flamelloides]KAJ6238278.1 18s rRNA (guanine-n(7))-methyltransferase-related [Anaeramoeba flamelloides]
MSRPEKENPPEIYYNNEEAKKYARNTRIIKIQTKMTERSLQLLNIPEDPPENDELAPVLEKIEDKLSKIETKNTSENEGTELESEGSYESDSPFEDEQNSEDEELLALEQELESLKNRRKSSFILDLGCGSGLSGQVLTQNGHKWVGIDISESMLDIAVQRNTIGDKILLDMGQGLPFRTGVFDGAIAISSLQWLCYSNKKTEIPFKRLSTFFSSLYKCLSRDTRAIFQFYPESPDQIEMITTAATKSGFTGGLVVDYPESTRAKKFFLTLFSSTTIKQVPKGLGGGENLSQKDVVQYVVEDKYKKKYQNNQRKKRNWKPRKKSRQWILRKKERQRKQGHKVRPDSKFTGRKRKDRW